jgi:hypothetical protein
LAVSARERPLRSRALGVIGAVSLAAATGLGLLAWRSGRGNDAALIEHATAAVGPAPLSTVPPLVAPPPPSSAPGAPSTVLERSPLADRLGSPQPATIAAPSTLPAPIAITIESIRLRQAPIVPVGVTATGELEVPGAKEVGWYRLGARPGETGATVLAAHVSWNGAAGRFAALASIAPGAPIVVTLADGATRTYQAVERAVYDKQALPAERVWAQTGPETLVLITCGGRFNPSIRHYRDNVVVYALPVAATPAG